jgi:S-DNA-T family DNA segregation ATPase FtsK/SpoIIIE
VAGPNVFRYVAPAELERLLGIGYGRAARLIDIMEKDGIVGPPDGTKPREVLKAKDWMREIDQSMR